MACIKLYPQEAIAGELKKLHRPPLFFQKLDFLPLFFPTFRD